MTEARSQLATCCKANEAQQFSQTNGFLGIWLGNGRETFGKDATGTGRSRTEELADVKRQAHRSSGPRQIRELANIAAMDTRGTSATKRAGHCNGGCDQGHGQEMVGAGDVGKLYSRTLRDQRRHQGSQRLRHTGEYVSSRREVHQSRYWWRTWHRSRFTLRSCTDA